MTIWQPDLKSRTGPKYLQIADAIGEAVASGDLAEGERLPPQRDLAYDLGLSLSTVTRGYDAATERGFLTGEVGRGTYVRTAGQVTPYPDHADMTRPASGPIDFAHNLPMPGESARALAATLGELKRSPSLASLLDYQTEGDQARHTAAGAKWLTQVGLERDGSGIVLTLGAQHGLIVALMATMRPGDVLLCEALTYAPVKAMAQQLNLRIVPVEIDDGGLVPEALDAACRTTAAKALYCLPTLQTPTTVTMDDDRRAEIASIARRHDLLIIEDDVFGFLPSQRPRPIACHAPERTFYLSSVSKSLAPGLRVGYLSAPENHVRPVRSAVSLSCWMPPPLMAEVASIWINDGTADRLNTSQRANSAIRLDLAKRHLPDGCFRAGTGGFHILLDLPPPWRRDQFRAEAERRGVRLTTAETFAVEPPDAPNAVRLCLSHEVSDHRVIAGLETIASLLAGSPDTSALVI